MNGKNLTYILLTNITSNGLLYSYYQQKSSPIIIIPIFGLGILLSGLIGWILTNWDNPGE